MKSCADLGINIQTAHKLARLKIRLRAIQQSRAALHRKPERQYPVQDLPVATQKIDFGKLADQNFVCGQHVLKILVPLRDHRERVAIPMLGDKKIRTGFGINRVMEGLRKRLPEQERTQIVDLTAVLPSIAKVRPGIKGDLIATLLQAIFHAIEVESEIRAGRDLSAKIKRAGQAAQAVIDALIAKVVAAIDGPIVSQAEELSVECAAAKVRSQESALAR